MGKNRDIQDSEEQKNGENNQNTQNSKDTIVLGIYMHCQGCIDTVVKYLRYFEGVEQVETDAKNHKVTVKGNKLIPNDVAEKLRRTTNKHVTLISPIVKEKKDEKKEEKKQEPNVITVVLKVQLHCKGCASDVKYSVMKMDGVQNVETDAKKSLVTVKGSFEPSTLVDYLDRRAGKHAIIVKQNDKKEDNKNKKGEDNKNKKGEEKKNNVDSPQGIHPPGNVYAPQIFSDENPNGCSIM